MPGRAPLAAAILTGGRASRMGGARKPMLAVGGTPIIERQLAVLQRVAAPIRERLTRGALEASRLPEGVRVAEVGPETLAAYDPDGLLFVNVNTPHDYERAKEVWEERSKASRDRIMDELGP